jgi:hypothetical protein
MATIGMSPFSSPAHPTDGEAKTHLWGLSAAMQHPMPGNG